MSFHLSQLNGFKRPSTKLSLVLQALSQKRKDVAQDRHIWITHRQPYMANMSTRLAFVDETWLKTNMIKRTRWAPRGQRLVDYAPYGQWQTQTFVAALRHERLETPWVIDPTINKQTFEAYIQTQLAPSVKPGDVVILDNLSSHKSAKAARTLKDQGSWFLFLPPYSPNFNPIEIAFSKLKALVRKPAARSCEQLWDAVGYVCKLFTHQECCNCIKDAGYQSD